MKVRSSWRHRNADGTFRPSTRYERLRAALAFYLGYTGADRRERAVRLWRLVREPFLLSARVR